MGLRKLDHVNLRTADVAGMTAFYKDVLGLVVGPRPPFAFPGAWLYVAGQAVVHLVGVAQRPKGSAASLEHFAFTAEGLAEFLARLRRHKVPYRIAVVPGSDVRQVNLLDPEGNHLHVDFAPGEEGELADYDGR